MWRFLPFLVLVVGCPIAPFRNTPWHELTSLSTFPCRDIIALIDPDPGDVARRTLVSARLVGFASFVVGTSVERVLKALSPYIEYRVILLKRPLDIVFVSNNVHSDVDACDGVDWSIGKVKELEQPQNLPRCSSVAAFVTPATRDGYCKLYTNTTSTALVARRRKNDNHNNPVAPIICNAFNAYMKFARGFDDVLPLSKRGEDWLQTQATLYDSITTLIVGNCAKELALARSVIASQNMLTCYFRTTKTFEYSLRVIGGLLGAYSLTGDILYLDKAREAADMLLSGAFAHGKFPLRYDFLTPPGSWIGAVVRWVRKRFLWESHSSVNSMAGVGTFALEFEYLSRETRDKRYANRATTIHNSLLQLAGGPQHATFLQSSGFDVDNLQFIGSDDQGPLGSGGDSFYEYLLKTPLLQLRSGQELDQVNGERMAWYRRIESRMVNNGAHIDQRSKLPFDVVHGGGGGNLRCTQRYTALLAFVPGMLALGDIGGAKSLQLARSVADACYLLYEASKTSLGPEEVCWGDNDNGLHVSDSSYTLRPELIESLAVLLHVTGKDVYRKRGQRIFEALKKHCVLSDGLIASINSTGSHIDEMPSFVIAETLKVKR
jgi:hypothetical protein